ncbi:hypothetical protein J6590_024519 [Homalodisca vitripennis]|nr:hypothetical protein J6590_024519 [Homalodisca vitripennis]
MMNWTNQQLWPDHKWLIDSSLWLLTSHTSMWICPMETKFLTLFLDSGLTCDDHTCNVCVELPPASKPYVTYHDFVHQMSLNLGADVNITLYSLHTSLGADVNITLYSLHTSLGADVNITLYSLHTSLGADVNITLYSLHQSWC